MESLRRSCRHCQTSLLSSSSSNNQQNTKVKAKTNAVTSAPPHTIHALYTRAPSYPRSPHAAITPPTHPTHRPHTQTRPSSLALPSRSSSPLSHSSPRPSRMPHTLPTCAPHAPTSHPTLRNATAAIPNRQHSPCVCFCGERADRVLLCCFPFSASTNYYN